MRQLLSQLADANKRRNGAIDPNHQLGPLFFSTELAGEVGELCNIVKKLERAKLKLAANFSTASQNEMMEEAADTVIVLMLLLSKYDLEHYLGRAIVNKFNKTSEKIGSDVRMVEE